MKDPAFLFYSNDFLAGTFTMSHDKVGKYIRLLCLQHIRNGRLSEKDMINICGSYDEEVFSKFKKDGDNLYYNERLEAETLRRKSYSESRSLNRAGSKVNTYADDRMKNICLSCDNHMGTGTGTITETINEVCSLCFKKSNFKKKKAGKVKFQPPTIEEVKAYFSLNGYMEEAAGRFFEYYSVSGWVDSKGDKVRNWKQKAQAVWFKDENKKPAKQTLVFPR